MLNGNVDEWPVSRFEMGVGGGGGAAEEVGKLGVKEQERDLDEITGRID